MLDVGWSELLVIGVVALIVVGPKDLPVMFRTLGRFTAKARSMAREFQRAMDDAAKASGVGDAIKDVKDATSKKSLGLDALESAASKFEKWNPTKPAVKPAVAATAAAPVAAAATTPAATTATDAAKPPVKPHGPATQALADKRAAERAALLERHATPKAEAGVAEMVVPTKTTRKAVLRAPVAKSEVVPAVTAVKATAKAKPKAKPAAKKSHAE